MFGNNQQYGSPNNYANNYGSGTPNYGAGNMNSFSGNLGNGLGDLFQAFMMGNQNYSNPANAASPYLSQMGPMFQQAFNPYIGAGQQALPQLQGQYGQLLNNPGQKFNQIGQSFQQSPGYQFQVNQALGAANRAGAAGGMLGSPMEQQNIAGTVNNLANQDYYNWMNGATGMYNQGLQGMGNLYQTGFNASAQNAEDQAAALQSQASNAYAGAANQNQFNQGQAGGMGGFIGQGIGALSNLFNF